MVHLQRDRARQWPMLRELIEAGFSKIAVRSAYDGRNKALITATWKHFYEKYPKSQPVEKCAVIFYKNHARQGCFLSHWSILERIAASKEASFVFEDDVVFPKNFSLVWPLIQSRIGDLAEQPDVIFFGHNAARSHRKFFDKYGLLATDVPVFATHAYCISPRGAQKVLDYLAQNRPDAIDVLYKTLILQKRLHVVVLNRRFLEKSLGLSFDEAGRRETGVVFQNRTMEANIEHPFTRWIQDTFF